MALAANVLYTVPGIAQQLGKGLFHNLVIIHMHLCATMKPLITMCPNLALVMLLCSCLCFAELSDVLGLAVHGSYIYWTDRGNSQRPLGRADKHNGQHSEALLENIGGFHGLVAVNKSADPG